MTVCSHCHCPDNEAYKYGECFCLCHTRPHSSIPTEEGDNRAVSTESRRYVASVPETSGSYLRSDPSEDARTPAGTCVTSPDIEPRPICKGCGQQIDPDCCGCGDSKEYHASAMYAGHPFIPMGCDCYRDTGNEADEKRR